MIAGITVVEVTRDGKRLPLGSHNFVSLPSVGNRIVLPNSIGGLSAYNVTCVEHSPCKTDPATLADKRRTDKPPLCLVEVSLSNSLFENG